MAGTKIKGITIEIDGNTTKLQKALSSTNKDIKDTQADLKEVEKLLKFDPSNTELLEQKQRLLADAVEETTEKLDLLKTAQEEAAEKLTSGEIGQNEYDALSRQVIQTEQDLSNFEQQAEACNTAIDMSGNESEMNGLSGACDSVEGDMQDVSESTEGTASIWDQFWSGAAKVIPTVDVSNLMGTIISKVSELAGELAELNQAWQEAQANIAAGTGATGENLQGMTEAATNAYEEFQFAGTSLQDMGNIAGEVNTRFGLTGDELTDFTLKVATFAHTANTDAVTAVDELSNTMWTYGLSVDDVETLMDDLIYSIQAAGNGLTTGDLTTGLSNNKNLFDELGWSMEDALGFMSQYSWVGGDASSAIQLLATAYSRCEEKTDDAGAAMQEAMQMMQEWDGESNIFQQTIADTGLTIEDVFGDKQKAQTFVDKINEMGQSAGQLGYSLDNANGRMQSTADSMVTMSDEMDQAKRKATDATGETIQSFLEWAGSYGETLVNAQDGIDNTTEAQKELNTESKGTENVLKTAVDAWTDFGETLNDAQNGVNEATENMSKDTADSMSDMQKSVSTTANALANTKWNLGHVSVPHFYMSGSFNAQTGSVPTVYTRWYAKAYDTGVMFNSPTVLNTPYGSKGFGDGNGGEMVIGKDTMMSWINEASGGSAILARMNDLMNALGDYLPDMAAQKGIYLNGNTLVGNTASDMKEQTDLLTRMEGW